MPVETKACPRLLVGAALGLAAFGCKGKPKPPAAAPAPSAASSAKPAAAEAAERCRSLASTPSLRVGDAARPKSPGPEDENPPGDNGDE
ncbi:MAG TPA: hypothetical protein VGQ57_20330, partial [Polyangiaceae bacterium]|nr:hypothetical protein [Polyangiaceae bacterium]